MGRPPLPVGTFGKIGFVEQSSGEIQARARFRDYDGRTRLVAKTGRSRAAAERALKKELSVVSPRPAPARSLRRCGLASLADPGSTRRTAGRPAPSAPTARSSAPGEAGAGPAVGPRGDARCCEQGTGCDRRSSGPSAAKSTRACLSGMFALATRMARSPRIRCVTRLTRISVGKKAPRALTPRETAHLTALSPRAPRAVKLDLVDVVDWMLATGCRIGEALATRYSPNADGKSLLDLEAGAWEVNATVVRVPRSGLVVQSRPKTAAGWRVVALPRFRGSDARAAWEVGAKDGIVFAAPWPAGCVSEQRLRRPAPTARLFECEECAGTGYLVDSDGSFVLGPRGQRLRCDAGPWSWVTSHTFRKTVATRLDEAGFSRARLPISSATRTRR